MMTLITVHNKFFYMKFFFKVQRLDTFLVQSVTHTMFQKTFSLVTKFNKKKKSSSFSKFIQIYKLKKTEVNVIFFLSFNILLNSNIPQVCFSF